MCWVDSLSFNELPASLRTSKHAHDLPAAHKQHFRIERKKRNTLKSNPMRFYNSIPPGFKQDRNSLKCHLSNRPKEGMARNAINYESHN